MVKEATTTATEPKKEKKKPRSKEQQLADLQAKLDEERTRKTSRLYLDAASAAAGKNDFPKALELALKAVETLKPADAVLPMQPESGSARA